MNNNNYTSNSSIYIQNNSLIFSELIIINKISDFIIKFLLFLYYILDIK